MSRARPSQEGPSADSVDPQSARPDSTEVDLLMRLARRWRRLGAEQAAGVEADGAALSPHQQRALLALARLSRDPAGHDQHDQHDHADHHHAADGSAEHHHPARDTSAGHPPGAGVRISRLADHLGIAPRSATEVADALEDAGLLTRTPDPTDRRAVLLALTDAGRHTVERVRERRRAAADEAVATLSPTDRAELRRLLQALLDGS